MTEMKLKSHMYGLIGSAARWSGLLALSQRRMGRSLTVIAYHRVLPDEQCRDYPLPSLVTPATAFREQARWLASHCEVLPLARAVERFAERRAGEGRPIVAVTFDDGYADNVEAAATLEEFGIRGTFFVTTEFIGKKSLLWFDRAALAWLSASETARSQMCLGLGEDGFDDARQWVQRLKACDPAQREHLISELEQGQGPAEAKNFGPMTIEQVIDLHRRGHEIGSHTLTHPILPQLSDDELWREMHESRRFLEDRIGASVQSLAYPNGDYDSRVLDIAAAAGYRFAATTTPGFNDDRFDPLRLRRIDAPSRQETSEANGATTFRTSIAVKALTHRERRGPQHAGRGIAYLNSHYPSVSHTFIEREIAALRATGARIVPFSVRPSGEGDRIGEAHAQAADETVALLDRPWRFAREAAAQMLSHPVRALRAIVQSQRLSPPGVRERLRHLAYTVEAARLAREMRRSGVSHVHVHMANNGAMVALLACEHDPSIRYSLSIHGSAEFFHVDTWTLGPKAEGAMFVRCISDFCLAQVMAWTNPEAWQRFHVVRCGIDPGEESTRLSAGHSGPALPATRAFRMVTVGRLHPIKGYSLLLRACRTLDEQGIDWSLDVIGDGPERSRLESLASELNVQARVRFHGAVAAEDVAAHYEHADLMVMSSFMEGVPIVLMEAMARGLPVVATRVGGVSELVEDGVSGLLVSPGSEPELASAIGKLATDEQRRIEMGRAGREHVVKQYNQARLGEEMAELFRRYGVIAPERSEVSARARQWAIGNGQSEGGKRRAIVEARRRWLAISPCRNEAAYMRETLDSVLAQTVRPDLWVIVDDGSTDDSPAILKEYAARHDFIRIIRRTDRGRRSVGPGVVDAVNAGLDAVDLDDFDYLCKLDLDLRLPRQYFETLIAQMEADPMLGTCSGKPYFTNGRGRLVSEMIGDDVSAGMTKFYRVECFRQIGGFVREVMWDGIDCHRCRMHGWRARSWDDPELRFLHLRPMGSSQKSIWSGRFRHGYGQWFMGTSLPYMTASAVFRMSRPPLVLGGLAMLSGYVAAMVRRLPRYPDDEFRQFLRSFQRQALLRGKGRAVELVEGRAQTSANR